MKKIKFRGFFKGEKGQRIFNYAYSLGASVVILGALFKLIHVNHADIWLIIGMGTEVFVFFVAAFERVTEKVDENVVKSARNIPGVVTTTAKILSVYDIVNAKQLVIDKALMEDEFISGHPGISTSTLQLKQEDLLKFVESTGHSPVYIDLPDPRVEEA